MSVKDLAYLALADGTLFPGRPLGACGRRTGEAVFNTSMTGYQEILTDPSYCRQIVIMTAPHRDLPASQSNQAMRRCP